MKDHSLDKDVVWRMFDGACQRKLRRCGESLLFFLKENNLTFT